MINIYKNHITTDRQAEGEDLANDMIRDIFEGRFDMEDNTLRNSLSSRIQNWRENDERSQSLRDIESDAFISIKQIIYE